MSNQNNLHHLTLLALPVVLIAALVGPIRPHSTAPRTRAERPASSLRNFKVGSHMFGAKANGVVIAGLDHALQIGFRGANAIEPQTASTDSDGAQPLEVVTWPNLWDGISLTYRASATGIAESVYTLAPGANAADIQLTYGTPVALNADGSLSLRYDTGQLTESAPIAWQVIDGQRRGVDVQFRLLDAFAIEGQGSMVGFTLGAHDLREAVVIDPTLDWNYFLGTSFDESAAGLTVDSSGNVYVVGTALAPWGAPNRGIAGSQDAYVIKLSSSGAITWLTFLGGAANDSGTDIVVDGTGLVTVLGDSDATWGSPVQAFAGSRDMFVARLAADGTLTWNTFFGGSGAEQSFGIAQDGSNNLIVTGSSTTSWGSPASPHSGYSTDVVIGRLTGAAGGLMWHSFVGGASYDVPADVQVVGTSAYVAGRSGAVWGLPIVGHSGSSDVFITRVSVASGAVQWNTFLGGAGHDDVDSLAVDGSGNVFASGTSESTWGAPVRGYGGSSDIFAARLNASGVLQWNTFLGGSDLDFATGVALGAGGSLYVSGQSNSAWSAPLNGGLGAELIRLSQADGSIQWSTFVANLAEPPLSKSIVTDAVGMVYMVGDAYATWGSPLTAYSSGSDGFVAIFNGAGTPQWHTYIGTGSQDKITSVQVDPAGNIFVAGSSSSNMTWGNAIRPHAGLIDALVAKYQPDGTRTWMTFLGGAGNDFGEGLALDGDGTLLISGYSTSPWGTPVRAYAGSYDTFVARLAPDGALHWNTFLGGTGVDSAIGVRPTPAGIVVAGTSNTTWGTPLRSYTAANDLFVATLNATGGLIWNTFLGGTGHDSASRMSTSADGTVHVIGYSSTTWGTPVTGFAGGDEAVVAAVDPAGTLVWMTFLGGSGLDYGYGIVDDNAGHLFVVGTSATTWGSPQEPHSIGIDAFAARLSSTNGVLQWHTFMGSGGTTIPAVVAVRSNGTVLVAGKTDGSFGTAWRPYVAGHGIDAFLAEVDATGALRRTAFFGDLGSDVASALAVLPSGEEVVLGGFSSAGWGDSQYAWASYAGGQDGFIAHIDLADPVQPLLLPFIMR